MIHLQVERWMLKKAKDADAMNFENEQQTKYLKYFIFFLPAFSIFHVFL